MKDYCSFFPEKIADAFIGDCCKIHDNEVGERGSYNPLVAIKVFWNCLTRKRLLWWRIIIVTGGTIMALIKYPYFAYKKYKYRKKKG